MQTPSPPLGGCFRGSDMLVFPPYQGTPRCGTVSCQTVARGGSSPSLLCFIYLSLPLEWLPVTVPHMWQTQIPSDLSVQADVWALKERNEVLGACQLSGISGYHSEGWREISAVETSLKMREVCHRQGIWTHNEKPRVVAFR